MKFKTTSHLSEILEESGKHPVVIFKYSNSCYTSEVLKRKIEEAELKYPLYLLTVQNMPVLSKNIESVFAIKHESPQIIIMEKGKVTYHESHNKIDIKKIVKT